MADTDRTGTEAERRVAARDRFRRQLDRIRSTWDERRWADYAAKYGPERAA
jgi:hypothetical protein